MAQSVNRDFVVLDQTHSRANDVFGTKKYNKLDDSDALFNDSVSMVSNVSSIFDYGDFQEKCILIAGTVDREGKLSTTHKMWIARQKKNAKAGKLNQDDASFLDDLIESLGIL